MANAWAFPALWAGLTIIAKLFAMGFEALSALGWIVAGAVARAFRGVISDISGLQSASQWNQLPGSTGITRQLNSKIRRWRLQTGLRETAKKIARSDMPAEEEAEALLRNAPRFEMASAPRPIGAVFWRWFGRQNRNGICATQPSPGIG